MAIIGTWTSNNTQLFGGIKRFSHAQAEAGNYKLPVFDEVKRDSDVVSDMSVIDKYFKNMQERETAGAYWDSTSFGKFLYASVSTNKPTRVGSYRRMAMFPEVGDAIDEICDNAMAFDENNKIVSFKLNRKFDAAAEKEINAAAEEYLDLFNFESSMFEIMRQLVVEGEVCWENIISKDHPDAGVIGINPIPCETYDFAIDTKANKKTGIIINIASSDQSADNKEGSGKNNTNKRVVGNMSVETLSSINNLSSYEKIKNGEVCYMPFEQVTYANTGLISFDGLMVYPVLERARKAYNQLSLIEDAIIIYRLVRAPERYVFNVDTGTASRARAEQEVLKMMKRYNTKKVYNPTTGTTTNEYDPTLLVECLALSTKIPLLDGRTLTLSEIISEFDENKKQLWAYSFDPETGKFAPGKISWAGVTRKNAELVKITLDNGETEICTPDHKFPVWGKGKVEAQDLIPGDSLIAFNRKNGKVKKHGRDYEMVYDHASQRWVFTHQEVADYFRGTLCEEYVYDESYRGEFTTRHHKNLDANDNSPENLVWMNWKDHWKLHGSTMQTRWADPEFRANTISKSREFWSSEDNKQRMSAHMSELYSFRHSKHIYNAVIELIKSGRAAFVEDVVEFCNNNSYIVGEFRKVHSGTKFEHGNVNKGYVQFLMKSYRRAAFRDVVRELNPNAKFLNQGMLDNVRSQKKLVFTHDMLKMVIDQVKKDPSIKMKDCASILVKDAEFMKLMDDANGDNPQYKRDKIGWGHIQSIVRAGGYDDFRLFRKEATNHNHRVVSVERLPYREDTGTLVIDGDNEYHDYHTFALASGVVTTNSFWFSKPAGSTGTTVDTLSSSVNLGEMKDLDYFLRKLYVSLKIPYNRYAQPEINIQRGEQINYEEYRFAKFIMRLQQCLAKGLANGLISHLRLRGVWDRLKLRNRDFIVQFTPPTSFDIYESQKRLQLMTERYSLMAQYQEMSKTLLQKKYLGWTEIDVEENWRFLEEEQMKAAKIRWKTMQIEQTGKVGKPGTDPYASQVVGGEGQPGEPGTEGQDQQDQSIIQPAQNQGAGGGYPGLPPSLDSEEDQQGQDEQDEEEKKDGE